jgi:hypothetical protein
MYRVRSDLKSTDMGDAVKLAFVQVENLGLHEVRDQLSIRFSTAAPCHCEFKFGLSRYGDGGYKSSSFQCGVRAENQPAAVLVANHLTWKACFA